MKYILLLFIFSLSFNSIAQELPKKSKIFVRVYNAENKKIAKGKMLKITDSTLILKRERKLISINSSEIYKIKTKRGAGHNALIGAAPGGAMLVLSAVSPHRNSLTSAIAIISSIAVSIFGAGVGLITSFFKNSVEYIFNDNEVKWNTFMEEMYKPQK